MFNLDNKPLIFLSAASFLLLCGFAVKVDKYETNNLLTGTSNYSRLIIKPSSFKKLNIKTNDWFNYYLDGKEVSQLVIFIATKVDHYEVILASNDSYSTVSVISYKIGQNSIWSEIFS